MCRDEFPEHLWAGTGPTCTALPRRTGHMCIHTQCAGNTLALVWESRELAEIHKQFRKMIARSAGQQAVQLALYATVSGTLRHHSPPLCVATVMLLLVCAVVWTDTSDQGTGHLQWRCKWVQPHATLLSPGYCCQLEIRARFPTR